MHAGLEPADANDEARVGCALPHDTQLFPREGLIPPRTEPRPRYPDSLSAAAAFELARRLPMNRRAAAYLITGLLLTGPALACTDVRLIAADGSAFTVRTMEFAADLNSET